ncbi:MAG TPA: recombinase family protein [Streptosporangiaceae bacterium]|nr:recombinase family protein [Streptosporangiaceae bacterium]
MGAPAPQDLTTSPERVPVAFYGRTSTLVMQDPAASLRRQLRGVHEKLPSGWFVAAHYYDIESGGLDLEARGHGTAHEQANVGIPRDGGMASLLAEAASPVPRFAAVICEDIERSARDTFSALKLEKELSAAGVPLFATDEPIDIAGANATTVLVRRVKQGVAEWFRLQIKEKAWKGMRESALAGWNTGTPPYGYQAERVPHPVPFKAAQGRTKTRLVLDEPQARVVAQIFAWRVRDRLGIPAITDRLNADPAAYPPPDRAAKWLVTTVWGILGNPKYTGHMVFGRKRTINGKTRYVPADEWLWSPEPAHPAIVTRALWDKAQEMGAKHATTRDDLTRSAHPATRKTYALRSRVRCRDCRRRMTGITRTTTRYWDDGPDYINTYFICPHKPNNPRHMLAHPDHPRTVSVREDTLMTVVGQFFQERIFGPERRALLAQATTATPAQEQERRDKDKAQLTKRLRQIDTAENAQAREIEHLAHLDPDNPAVQAMRSRHLARFTELEDERAKVSAELANLAKHHDDGPGDPALLDALPMLGDLLAQAPARLKMELFAAFDLQCLYNKEDHQVSIRATVTTATPGTVAALVRDSETPDAPVSVTECTGFSDLIQSPMCSRNNRDHGNGALRTRRPSRPVADTSPSTTGGTLPVAALAWWAVLLITQCFAPLRRS